jgi:hypothetical protein
MKRARNKHFWTSFSDEKLLDVKFCDLGLDLQSSWLEPLIERLHDEMTARGILLRPHVWLAEEWFSPDGTPGIAIPFYLAHPRLMRLERKQMQEVEGGTPTNCLRILRHEAGHCVETAFRLNRRVRWGEVFGQSSIPYPDYYRPRPNSKNYVQHLDRWYAQSHPSEDFAETFAVWLRPRSGWRANYQGWSALKKLEYVDELMSELAGRRPLVRSRRHVESVREIRKTLGEHYAEKRAKYETGASAAYDRELFRLFSNAPRHAAYPSACAFLKRHRAVLRSASSVGRRTTGYAFDQVLSEMIARCSQLRLRLRQSEGRALRETLSTLATRNMNERHASHHRLAL